MVNAIDKNWSVKYEAQPRILTVGTTPPHPEALAPPRRLVLLVWRGAAGVARRPPTRLQ